MYKYNAINLQELCYFLNIRAFLCRKIDTNDGICVYFCGFCSLLCNAFSEFLRLGFLILGNAVAINQHLLLTFVVHKCVVQHR